MTEKRAAAIELLRRRARVDLLAFVQWCWDRPFPFKVGRHTRAFCDWFNQAIERWLKGDSSYLLFNCPPRHGKSDLCQFASAYMLGRLSQFEPSLIYTGYGASLVKGFSKRIRGIVRSEAYRALFPGVTMAADDASVDSWRVDGSNGVCTFTGLGGGLTGKGGHLLILDDYCKSAEEADSEVYRDKTWEGFAADLMTRQMPPASIVIVTATPWHMDDLTMRIRKKVASDGDFPRFEQLVYPAIADEYDALFPELYDVRWYEQQRATLGSVRWSAMFLCNPIGEGQRLFRDEWLNFYSVAPKDTENYIFVDTAGSKKRKNNDYLVMWVIGIGRNGNYYVLDGVRDKLNLTERTETFLRFVRKYRPRHTWWEQIGAQTDLEHVQLELERQGEHTPISPLGQKVSKEGRILWLQPLFEEGRIWFPDKMIRQQADGRMLDLISMFREDEYGVYPSVVHDDMLDCLANIRHPDVLHITARYDHYFRGNGRDDTVAPTSYKREPWKR